MIILDEHIMQMIQKQEPLGRGATAIVYPYLGKAIKIFKEAGRKMANIENMSKLKGRKNDTFVFLEQIETDKDGQVVACIMELVEGKSFIDEDVIKTLPFEQLREAIQKVEEDIRKLAEVRIVTNDMNHKNIMWDTKNKKIRIIDTEPYYIDEKLSEKDVYCRNLGEFNNSVNMVLECLGTQGTACLLYESKYVELKKQFIMEEVMGNAPSVNLLIDGLKCVAEERFGRKFNNLQEIEEEIRRQKEQEEQEKEQSPHKKFAARIADMSAYGYVSIKQPENPEIPTFEPPLQSGDEEQSI